MIQGLIIFLQIYEILILVRIILSWVAAAGIRSNIFFEFIYRVTEPFLAFFRRIPIFTIGIFDFSPIAALITIGIFRQMLTYGNYSLSTFLAFFIIGIWSIFKSIFFAIIIIFAIRLIFLLLKLFSNTNFIESVDSFLLPLSVRINKIVTDKFMSYSLNLLVSIGLLLAFTIIINQAVIAISILLSYIPF